MSNVTGEEEHKVASLSGAGRALSAGEIETAAGGKRLAASQRKKQEEERKRRKRKCVCGRDTMKFP